MTNAYIQDLLPRASEALSRLRERAPRVQCLTNTVAQPITANVLLALGARASMATHPDEVVAMSESADALLVNLGTPDAARIEAIHRLDKSDKVRERTVVLDPVFVEHSPLRMDLARIVTDWDQVIVKANADEARALAAAGIRLPLLAVTGSRDYVVAGTRRILAIDNGEEMMTKVTGLGCALGAVIAAFAAVEPDPVRASAAGLLTLGIAAEHAAHRSTGPGTFAAYLLDAIANLEGRDLISEAKLEMLP